MRLKESGRKKVKSERIPPKGRYALGILRSPRKSPPQNFPLQLILRRWKNPVLGAAHGHAAISKVRTYCGWSICNLPWLYFVSIYLVLLGQQPADFSPDGVILHEIVMHERSRNTISNNSPQQPCESCTYSWKIHNHTKKDFYPHRPNSNHKWIDPDNKSSWISRPIRSLPWSTLVYLWVLHKLDSSLYYLFSNNNNKWWEWNAPSNYIFSKRTKQEQFWARIPFFTIYNHCYHA